MNNSTDISPELMFTETDIGRRNRFIENVVKIFFLIMACLMILPLLLIIGYLFYKALPVLSLDFLFTNPKDNMRAGGVWAPFLGTIYLVVVSLLVAAPIGVFAAVYLNEYARDNWFTRIVNLAARKSGWCSEYCTRAVRCRCICAICWFRGINSCSVAHISNYDASCYYRKYD